MQKSTKGYSLTSVIIIVLGMAMIITGSYFYLSDNTAQPVTAIKKKVEEIQVIEPVAQQQPVAEAEQSVAQPTISVAPQEVEAAIELPLLNDSDALLLASLQQLTELNEYRSLLNQEEMIRNFVVFIDNFSRGELLTRFSPLIKPGEPFSTVKVEQKMYLNPDSYQRYNIYADIIDSMDIDAAISQYRTLQPLFDEAYREIASPQGVFSDSLKKALAVALDAPVIVEPIALIAPSAMYKFADPELEALPAAQKLLIRMGPENTLKLKTKLQQIQQALQTDDVKATAVRLR